MVIFEELHISQATITAMLTLRVKVIVEEIVQIKLFFCPKPKEITL